MTILGTSPLAPSPLRETATNAPPLARTPGVMLTRRAALILATSIIGSLARTDARADTVGLKSDQRMIVEDVTFPVGAKTCRGMVHRPTARDRRPSILLVPDQRGISPGFVEIANRLAMGGYVTLLPNFASLVAPENMRPEDARDRVGQMPDGEQVEAIGTAIRAIAAHPASNGSVAVIAFVWGGTAVARIATNPPPPLKAVVLYYTQPPGSEEIENLKVPVQLHYAGLDPKTQPFIAAVEKKLMGHAKIYEQYVYDNVQSSFANKAQLKRYNPAAAELSLERTEFFLRQHLG